MFQDATRENLLPIAVSIAEACRMSGLGRTTIFAEIKVGRLRAVKAGGRTLIRLTDLRNYLDSLPTAGTKAA